MLGWLAGGRVAATRIVARFTEVEIDTWHVIRHSMFTSHELEKTSESNCLGCVRTTIQNILGADNKTTRKVSQNRSRSREEGCQMIVTTVMPWQAFFGRLIPYFESFREQSLRFDMLQCPLRVGFSYQLHGVYSKGNSNQTAASKSSAGPRADCFQMIQPPIIV